jgi:hypothetical protein
MKVLAALAATYVLAETPWSVVPSKVLKDRPVIQVFHDDVFQPEVIPLLRTQAQKLLPYVQKTGIPDDKLPTFWMGADDKPRFAMEEAVMRIADLDFPKGLAESEVSAASVCTHAVFSPFAPRAHAFCRWREWSGGCRFRMTAPAPAACTSTKTRAPPVRNPNPSRHRNSWTTTHLVCIMASYRLRTQSLSASQRARLCTPVSIASHPPMFATPHARRVCHHPQAFTSR